MKKYYSFRIFLILIFVTFTVPSYALIKIPDNRISNFVLIDINNDGKKELIASKDNSIIIYQFQNNTIKEIGRNNTDSVIKQVLYSNKECFIFSNKILFLCKFTSSKPFINKLLDLSKENFNFLLEVNINGDVLNVIGVKYSSDLQRKASIVLLKFFSNKEIKRNELITTDNVYGVYSQDDKGTRIIIAKGAEEKVDKLILYSLNKDNLQVIKNINFSNMVINSPWFYNGIGKAFYISCWKGDVDSNSGYFGILKFDIDTEKTKDIIKIKYPTSSIIIGDINSDGKEDIIWKDDKGLNIELNCKQLN